MSRTNNQLRQRGTMETSEGRLATMQRADKNIDDLLETLHATCHRLRQDAIDEELFDVIAGYEALRTTPRHPRATAATKDGVR